MRKCRVIRFFDILFSLSVIVILSPLLIFVSLLLKFTGEGEVFYLQERVGQNNIPFFVIKFATMKKNSPFTGAGTITIDNDPRVLPVGRFLRASKINELPQIINILKGDMSIIGPRPLTADAYKYYSVEGVDVITSVRPGLSGIGSVIFRDEESILAQTSEPKVFHRRVIGPYKEELEVWYVKNKSLTKYFLLILLTALAVVFPKNKIVWKVFSSLPNPVGKISDYL